MINASANTMPEAAIDSRKPWVEPVLITTSIKTTASGSSPVYGEGVATPLHIGFGSAS